MDIQNQEKVELPERITNRLEEVMSEAELLLSTASTIQQTRLTRISFTFEQSAPRDILTEYERAQSICFVTKYESLPDFNGIQIAEEDGNFSLENMDFVRHILNEYRPLIQNQLDSIYYQNIHKFIRSKLTNKDSNIDLALSVWDEEKNDVTDTFTSILDERIKTIRKIIEALDFRYIYNGILQHSDHRYNKRLLDEYHSGEINYIFLKHALLLGPIKQNLKWHYKIINFLTFPKLGSM